MAAASFKSLSLDVHSSGVAHLRLSRPHASNAMDLDMFRELPIAVASADDDPSVRVVIISGQGKHFCAGIDLQTLSDIASAPGSLPSKAECEGRKREAFRRQIVAMQESLSALERCRKPIIAAIHGACVGGGVDLATACDVRFASSDARFAVKEVDLAITADLGTLQRLPRLVGYGNAMHLALTARPVDADEALRLGLVQGVWATREELMAHVQGVAEAIARKSPLAVAGTKAVLRHARDHSVADGLQFVATWNAAMLLSDDLTAAVAALATRKQATFSRL
ncbi:hypothetical protein CLOP_g1485 [Closterium sp. NIES-67]|nr:hypothetical protein CLOP_g1485 [Closterium sp. NIES-67]